MPVLRRLALASLLAVAAPAAAQSGPPDDFSRVDPAAAARFDAARLARIDAWLQGLVAQQKIPGAVAMIVKDGRVAYYKAFGARDVATGAPLRPDDVFRIASQTKAVTSTAAMMLWEEGKLGLDDPVSKYIPAFDSQTVLVKFDPRDSSYTTRPAKRRTTIRELLTHTGGLDYAEIGSDEFKAIYAKAGIHAIGREGETLADRIPALGRLPLALDPGEHFRYSLGVDVLGRVVEVASGVPLDRFFRTRIFEPLGMRDTYFAVPADERARLVTLHTLKDGRLVATHDPALGIDPDYPARPVTYFAGGAGLSGTVGDYARFLQMYLNGGELGGRRLLGRKTVELMLTNQLPAGEPAFGLGFGLETPANDAQSPLSVGSFSWGGAFNTTYWADPKERLVGLVYTNTWDVGVDLGTPFKALVYSALK